MIGIIECLNTTFLVIFVSRLAACFEGRNDDATHEFIRRRLERENLEKYTRVLDDELRSMKAAIKLESRLPQVAELEVGHLVIVHFHLFF